MPHGFNGTARKNALNSETELQVAREKLAHHDSQLRQRGYDPNYIGVTEVEPVCCRGCGKTIPWAVLAGYRR